MAMTKCKECGHDISTKADKCPSCGAKQARTTLLTKVIGAFVVLVAVVAVTQSVQRSNQEEAKARAEAERIAKLTPEQKKAETDAKTKTEIDAAARRLMDDAMYSRAMLMAAAIRKSANDPSSIKFSEAGYTDDGTVLLVYRGKNAFNATILNRAILTKDGKAASGSESQVAELWNRHIAGKRLNKLPTP